MGLSFQCVISLLHFDIELFSRRFELFVTHELFLFAYRHNICLFDLVVRVFMVKVLYQQ